MKVDIEMKKYIVNTYELLFLLSLIYLFTRVETTIKNEDFYKEIGIIIWDYGRFFLLPLVFFTFTILGFLISYYNKETTRNKIIIELEDKTSKEFTEIKEILEAIVQSDSESYQLLLTNLKIKEKSIEEKLLDKMEGKRFKFYLNYDNEELEYKKQITKMNKIINKGINNIALFLIHDENEFDLSEEDIKSLKDNIKIINNYFQNTYKKKILPVTVEQEIKEKIIELLDELKEVTNSDKINSIKSALTKVTSTKNKNKELNWLDVQNSAREMIRIIDKI